MYWYCLTLKLNIEIHFHHKRYIEVWVNRSCKSKSIYRSCFDNERLNIFNTSTSGQIFRKTHGVECINVFRTSVLSKSYSDADDPVFLIVIVHFQQDVICEIHSQYSWWISVYFVISISLSRARDMDHVTGCWLRAFLVMTGKGFRKCSSLSTHLNMGHHCFTIHLL